VCTQVLQLQQVLVMGKGLQEGGPSSSSRSSSSLQQVLDALGCLTGLQQLEVSFDMYQVGGPCRRLPPPARAPPRRCNPGWQLLHSGPGPLCMPGSRAAGQPGSRAASRLRPHLASRLHPASLPPCPPLQAARQLLRATLPTWPHLRQLRLMDASDGASMVAAEPTLQVEVPAQMACSLEKLVGCTGWLPACWAVLVPPVPG
jgi:hypothetical protein